MSARSKNLWTLLGAAVVAAGLGLYAWFGVMKGDEKEAEQKRAAERLVQPVSRPDGGTENVRYDRLVVKAKGQSTELSRLPDSSWVITRPLKTADDAQTGWYHHREEPHPEPRRAFVHRLRARDRKAFGEGDVGQEKSTFRRGPRHAGSRGRWSIGT